MLEQAGLITRGRTAQLRPSRLEGAPLRDAVEWLEKYRAFWEGSFDRLEARLRMTEAMADGIEITRVFDAPRERVWQEWTEPERFADWFGGPESEVPLATVSMDVRRGRHVAGDDVRRPEPPRDPVEGRVPRGGRAGAARLHGHRPARATTPTSW